MAELARPESAVVRFRDAADTVVGAGFLVGDGLIVSCAHVVAAALGRNEKQQPTGPVTVEFPVRGPLGPTSGTATVIGWTPTEKDERGDIAVLRFDGGVPEGVRAAWLSPAPPPAGTEVQALGFPAALNEPGVWSPGRVRGEQATGWLQVDSLPDSSRILPGFSGTPVFGPADGGVIGMVVAVNGEAGHTSAFLITAGTLVTEHTVLHDAQVSPYRGLVPFGERDVAVFRGRDTVIGEALGKAAVHPLLVLFGPSGSGKSSLARAGLLPRLREQGRTVVSTRARPDETAATLFTRIVRQLTGTAAGAEPEPGVGPVADRLRDREGLVVLVDQLEEADPATAMTVTGDLYRLAEATGMLPGGEPRLLVVLTLRGAQLDEVATGETPQAGLVQVRPMTAAELLEAVTAPGAVFETGLAERIVADAGTEPGTLPLLEFTLDRLWDRRQRGVLTHDGYDKLGGVAGAVAQYAERAYERDRVRTRRLLVLLAGPDDDGVFRRRPLRLSDLPEELTATLDRLVAARLVVVGPDAAEKSVAELAHETLIRAWPRLRDWLKEDRAFLTWLAEVRRATRRWHEAHREPEALLRGAALATAEHWAADKGRDLGPEETRFVRASVAQDRQRVRRKRAVTAALVVLTLLAGAFALAAQQQTGVVREQLRTAVSRQLADDAERFRAADPAKSLQLALAAWHTAPTPEAYGALLTQYATYEPVERFVTGLTATPDAPITAVSTSRDGSVAVVADPDGGGTVWRGLGAGDPQRVVFTARSPGYIGGTYRISPSGRYLAYANDLGGVYFRDLTRPDLPPVDLAPTGPDGVDLSVVRSLRFAPDDSRLLVLRTDLQESRAELRAWDLRSRQAVPGLPRPGGRFVPSNAYFGPTAGTVVLAAFNAATAYDLAGRRDPREFPAEKNGRMLVAAGGTLVVSCAGVNARGVVRDVATGARLRTFALPTCIGFDLDSSGEFGVVGDVDGGEEATNASLTVVDPRTAEVRRVPVPPVDFRTPTQHLERVAVYRRSDGTMATLLADDRHLMRLSLGPPVTLQPATGSLLDFTGRTLPTPDGRHRVRFDRVSGRITVQQAPSGRQVAAAAAEPPPRIMTFQGVPWAVTADSRRLLTAHHGELIVYALPGLAVEHRAPLPVPPDLGPPPVTDGNSTDWAGSVAAVGAGEAIVLYAGVLTRWDLVTGTRLGEPVPLREGGAPGAQRRVAELAFVSGRRPGHPDQIAVVLPDSTVRIWSLADRRSVTTFKVDAKKTATTAFFNPEGSHLAVQDQKGVMAVWPVADPRRAPWVIPTDISSSPLGFTRGPESLLITVEQLGATELSAWQVTSARRAAVFTAPGSSLITLQRDELRVFTDGYTRRLRLDPQLWFRTLCALAARPYTAEETRLLRDRKAPVSRPCP